MKKDFESVFDKNISIDEYKLDNLLNKNIEINEKEFPAILIDKNDDINKYININNINSNEIVDKENENIEINETIENNAINETENIADNENNSNDAYTEEENNLYGDLEETVALKDSDLIGIEDIDDFNLEDAVFENKKNNESEEIYKNNSENSNIENNEELNNIEKEFEKSDYDKVKEIDLIEEDNLKKENEILEYNDKEVIVPSIDSIDYIDESNYINESDSEDEIIELSGNELDLITKDNDISEDINYSVSISEMDNEKKNNENEENIIKVSDENMRKDNFLLEEQPIENSSENINDINNNINTEEEEQKRTDYYINKYKKLHEDYIKYIEEENNKIKEENKQEELNDKLISKEKEEETKNDNEIIENITEDIKEEDKTNYYINKYKKLHEDYIKSIEEENNNKIKEENKQKEIIENKIENIEISKENIENKSALNDLDISDKLSAEEEEMYKNYLGEDLNLVENENDTKEEEIKKNDNEIIENITEDIKKEEDKTNYYINKYKKLHEDYIKSIEEENNKIKEDNKQEEIIENKIENIETSKENIAPVIEEEITDKLSTEEEEMYKSYLGEDLNLIEDTGDLIIEEEILEENIENEFPLNNLEITDKLSAEEEEMYKAYLGEDLELIDDIKDSENIAKSLMDEYKKEMLSNKVEISGELSEEEENIVDDILKKNKNQYYEDTIDYDSIILKELNLNEIEEIDENDFNILENFILGKEQEKGIELISINNENILKKNDFNVNNDSKSVDSFDSIDDDELLKVKENTMSEEKELYESEKKNIDLNVKVEEEFSLNKDDNESVLINEQVNKSVNKDDFDGEITQMDLDLAEKLFENEDQLNNEEYSLKHDLLLSESDIGKFRKLFSYFKNIVDKLPQDNLNEFSKTEFYDIYSALFRKFGE
ncbi:hypothetical protein EPJ74_10810 [Brachyspira aalborgi]|uniref:Uncharacterized protein n=1 Tax=Brachyspira aalborgi TaxID=29522 RepID=A0A5C8GCW1_9SPIR|nr:hypothetical protein [Brachyspira aalborgi]TXJ59589.1 hypothetical protein EPJ74_10810 [Brachyspira aalborgi]